MRTKDPTKDGHISSIFWCNWIISCPGCSTYTIHTAGILFS